MGTVVYPVPDEQGDARFEKGMPLPLPPRNRAAIQGGRASRSAEGIFSFLYFRKNFFIQPEKNRESFRPIE